MDEQIDSCAIMSCFVDFHMQDSGHYSINTKARGKFADANTNIRLICMSYCTDSDIVQMEEQMKLSEKFNENDFD